MDRTSGKAFFSYPIRLKHSVSVLTFFLTGQRNIFEISISAAVHGGLFIQDGQEYVYHSSATTSAGTMDVSPHMSGSNYKMKVRVQVSGKTLNVQVSEISSCQHLCNPTESTYISSKCFTGKDCFVFGYNTFTNFAISNFCKKMFPDDHWPRLILNNILPTSYLIFKLCWITQK